MSIPVSRLTMRASMGFPMRAADVPTGSSATNGGRWLVYTGDEIHSAVDGLSAVNKDGTLEPVRIVVDLETLHAQAPTIVALDKHVEDKPLGSWQDIAINPRQGITMSLTLAKPTVPGSLVYVQEVADLLAAKTPLQASIGTQPVGDGHWQLIAEGDSVVVNGQTFTADGDLPLYILRGGELFETSVVSFGADKNTGRLAAAAHKESSMTTPALNAAVATDRLAALLAKYPDTSKHSAILAGLAAKKTDDEIAAKLQADDSDQMTAKLVQLEKDCKQAKLDLEAERTAHDATRASNKAEMARMTAEITKERGTLHAAKSGADEPIPSKDDKDAVAENQGEMPKDLTTAMIQLKEKSPQLTNQAVRAKALKLWPKIVRA